MAFRNTAKRCTACAAALGLRTRWGGTTYRDNIVYVHILEWEKIRSRLKFRGIQWKNGGVISGGKAELTEENGTFSISVPIPERDSIDTILKLTFAEPDCMGGLQKDGKMMCMDLRTV